MTFFIDRDSPIRKVTFQSVKYSIPDILLKLHEYDNTGVIRTAYITSTVGDNTATPKAGNDTVADNNVTHKSGRLQNATKNPLSPAIVTTK